MDSRPIGIFDSGLGGLTVVLEIVKLLPDEKIIYFGDTARVPYGTRSNKIIHKFAWENVQFLLTKNIKCLVIACNTVSAVAAQEIKTKVKIPVFEMIAPGVQEAVRYSRIGLIGTKATVKSKAYEKAIKKINPQAKVIALACPLLVPLIEEGEIKGKILDAVLKKYLLPFKKESLDCLILGCTHYPIVEKQVKHYLNQVKLISPAKILAVNLKNYLKKYDLLTRSKNPQHSFFVSDITEMFLAKSIKGRLIKINQEK